MAVHPRLPVLHAHHDTRQKQACCRTRRDLAVLQAKALRCRALPPCQLSCTNMRTIKRVAVRVKRRRPSHLPAHRRELREEVYRAFLTRASSGDIDNTPVIARILEARDEQAKLLGFSCFAEKSMASKVRRSSLQLPSALPPWTPRLHRSPDAHSMCFYDRH